MASRRRIAACLALFSACIVAGNSASTRAAVLYDEDFTGLPTSTLNGQAPDVDNNGGFNAWAAHTNYTADGNMTPVTGGTGAFLPFIPTAGNIYTLSASLTGVTGNTNWVAIGFAEGIPANTATTAGNDYRFLSGAGVGKAWMLYRGQSTSATTKNQTQRGDASTGTFAANQLDWLGTEMYAGDIDLKIVLDTTAAYNATFYAKRPTDASYTQVSPSNLPLTATDIASVGFATSAAANVIDAKITNFTLETTGQIFILGDVDGNGAVNALDFNIIRDNLFTSVTTRSLGDLNNDGLVNFSDFRIWKSAASAEVLAEVGSFPVPEPASCGLLAAAGLGLIALRRRSVQSA
jgi:hypothetical protein